MIPFAGCRFCHCTREKFFLRKGADAKMLMLGPAKKHSFVMNMIFMYWVGMCLAQMGKRLLR